MTKRQRSAEEFEGRLEPLLSPSDVVVVCDRSNIGRLLPHAIVQAKSSDAAVTIVHSVSDLELIENERAFLCEAVDQLRADGVSCDVVVKHGNLVGIVRDVVAETQASRLIMGTDRHAPCGPGLLDPNIHAVLLDVETPIFVVSPQVAFGAHTEPRRILHPVSFEGAYRKTTRFATQLAQAEHAQLILVHVLDTEITASSYADVLLDKTRQDLMDIAGPVQAHYPTLITVRVGDAENEILDLAVRENVDWIVMSIDHDPPWWSMRSSLAFRIVARASSPVLIVKSRELPTD